MWSAGYLPYRSVAIVSPAPFSLPGRRNQCQLPSGLPRPRDFSLALRPCTGCSSKATPLRQSRDEKVTHGQRTDPHDGSAVIISARCGRTFEQNALRSFAHALVTVLNLSPMPAAPTRASAGFMHRNAQRIAVFRESRHASIPCSIICISACARIGAGGCRRRPAIAAGRTSIARFLS